MIATVDEILAVSNRARAQEDEAHRTGHDTTPYGVDGDHCPQCGHDWKQPHSEECPHYIKCQYPPGCEQTAVNGRLLCTPHLAALTAFFAPANDTEELA